MEKANLVSAKRTLFFLPVILISIALALLIAGGVLLLIYSVPVVVVLKNAMPFLIIFGGGMIFLGAGLLTVDGLLRYLSHYRNKFYSTPKPERKKGLFSYCNVCSYVMLLGVVLVIISAMLGSVQKDVWHEIEKPYYESNGYYVTAQSYQVRFNPQAQPIDKIVIENTDKSVFVKFVDEDLVSISTFNNYQDQVIVRYENGQITIKNSQSPSKDTALEKMLFFMFADGSAEKQLVITIPTAMRDSIVIFGDYTIVKN